LNRNEKRVIVVGNGDRRRLDDTTGEGEWGRESKKMSVRDEDVENMEGGRRIATGNIPR
jgi:hypothetical protein